MKRIYALLIMLLIAINAQAQAPLFSKGDEIVSLSLGVGNSVNYGVPITLSYELGLKDINPKSTIGVGALFSYQHKNRGTNHYYYDYTFNSVVCKSVYNGCVFAATGSYHYDLVKKLDLFADLALGFAIGNTTYKSEYLFDSDTRRNDNYFYYAIGVGARYYFTDRLAAFAKLHVTPSSFIEIGASYRFSVSSLFKSK